MHTYSFDRFAVVTVASEASSRMILEKMPKREIHGQNPTVLPCNKQSLSFFEGVTRKDAPVEPMPPMAAPPRKFPFEQNSILSYWNIFRFQFVK